MKQGSTDDPFAEEPEPVPDAEQDQANAAAEHHSGPRKISTASDTEPVSKSRTLPYIYKRDAVKEGRTQRPVYLRDYNENRIPDLIDDVEAELNEDTTKTDILEAAMETAIDNPRLVADTLRTERYGYDWE